MRELLEAVRVPVEAMQVLWRLRVLLEVTGTFRSALPLGLAYRKKIPRLAYRRLKGTVSRDFLLLVFSMNHLPPGP
jgi:hypothetical protein